MQSLVLFLVGVKLIALILYSVVSSPFWVLNILLDESALWILEVWHGDVKYPVGRLTGNIIFSAVLLLVMFLFQIDLSSGFLKTSITVILWFTGVLVVVFLFHLVKHLRGSGRWKRKYA